MSKAPVRQPAAPLAAVDLGGGVTVAAVTDAVSVLPYPIEEAFPGEPANGWDAVKHAYPEMLSADGHWRLAINTFLIRTPEVTMLLDTGVGCERTLAAQVFRVVGSLPDHLSRLGVVPEAVDTLFFTHLHRDHVGWAADPDSGEPTFPNARYLVYRGEWDAYHGDRQTPDWVEQALDPVVAKGQVDLIELGGITDRVEAVGLPGHSPGHCGLVVSGSEARAVLIGDAFNHPQQVAEPEIPSFSDRDRDLAIATRHEILERTRSGEWPLLASAHLPGAWWTAVPDGDGSVWQSRVNVAPVGPQGAMR